jgi:hypothetical protein
MMINKWAFSLWRLFRWLYTSICKTAVKYSTTWRGLWQHGVHASHLVRAPKMATTTAHSTYLLCTHRRASSSQKPNSVSLFFFLSIHLVLFLLLLWLHGSVLLLNPLTNDWSYHQLRSKSTRTLKLTRFIQGREKWWNPGTHGWCGSKLFSLFLTVLCICDGTTH